MVYTNDDILTSIGSANYRQSTIFILIKRPCPQAYYAFNRYIKGYIYICDSK